MKSMRKSIDLMRKINRVIRIPMVAGGNITQSGRCEKDFVYRSKTCRVESVQISLSQRLLEEVSKRFGKERIAVSLNDFDALFKQQHLN